MSLVSPSQAAPGEEITASKINTPVNQLASVINGNLDDSNISSLSGSKLTANSVPVSALAGGAGWADITGTVTAVTANGNRSYDLTTSADQTAVLSPGMRIRTTRTVAAPTRSTSLNGTTQYYSKTTPAGMTFTDDSVMGAWVKPSSYAAGAIISRFNGTSGFRLGLMATGQVEFVGFNGGGGNFRQLISYQSLPLNKWSHIAIQFDLSAAPTTSATTNYIMVDGVDVPCYMATAGTNPTAIVQAGDLQIGASNGVVPFPGKIAQAFVSSAKITQANVRTLISQGLTSALITSNSIISAYSFDNSINDLNTTSANNLTANGSAVATNADSPFGGMAGGTISSTLDYGIVQTVSASTIVVQVAEGCAIPTSGGVSAFSYSTYKSPFGFPGEQVKWQIETVIKTQQSVAGPVVNTWYSATAPSVAGSFYLTIPVGQWKTAYMVVIQGNGASPLSVQGTLSTANNTEIDSKWNSYVESSGTATSVAGSTYRDHTIGLSAATAYYFNTRIISAGATTIYNRGDTAASIIRAEVAYL